MTCVRVKGVAQKRTLPTITKTSAKTGAKSGAKTGAGKTGHKQVAKSQKPRKQYGVLPYLYIGGKLRVVVITSRTNANWIFPKGRRIPGLSRPDGALQEAREEAGLTGRRGGKMKLRGIVDHPDGKIDLTLYPMRVDKLLKRWPEAHQRKRAIVSVNKAARLLTFSTSKQMLRTWAKKHRKDPGKKG